MNVAHRIATLSVALLATGCASPGGGGSAASAKVALEPRSGSSVTGNLELRDTKAGLRIQGEVIGFAPGSEHGFHIHEQGDCSAPDAASAGSHFNPAGVAHGRAGSGAAHHTGDMANIKADATGVAKIDQVVAGVTLAPGANSATGRALVVHRDPDDYASQPAGNAGPRFACGVIR